MKYMRQKRITARIVKTIQDSIKLEEYADAIMVVEYYKISPQEWFLIINNLHWSPEEMAAIIKDRRRYIKRKLKEAGKL